MTKKEYIEKAVSGIKGKTERREVEEELSMHIDELTELWRGRGYDEAAAEEEAVKDMGYPETTAEELRAVHAGTFGDVVEVLVWIGIGLLCVGLFPLAYSFILVASDLFSMPLNPFCLAFEPVFLCLCTLLILYGVRRKSPFVCTGTAILYGVVFLIAAFYFIMGQSSENASPASAPVSPALFSAALALSGHWDEIPVLSCEYLGVTNPVVIVLSLLIFLLVPVSAMILADLYAKKTTKETLRTGKLISVLLICVCAFCILVNVPTAIVSYKAKQENEAKAEPVSYNDWCLLQYDETFPATEFYDTREWNNIDEAYRLEIVWDWQPANNFDLRSDSRNPDEYRCCQSMPSVCTQGSVPGLYDVYEFVAEWEFTAEKRYLLAIPENGSRYPLLNRAVWFDLQTGEKVRLKLSDDPEQYCYIDLVMTDRTK
ncbi:MAG: hypothetical protein IJK23_12235 [Clostridia bacterium]|nr:hypothetical protein [Clostridia bacterium]